MEYCERERDRERQREKGSKEKETERRIDRDIESIQKRFCVEENFVGK